MVKAYCRLRVRDKNGKIVGYLISDERGVTREVSPEELKIAIRAGQISVSNLTLTSDYRLIESGKICDNSKNMPENPYNIEVGGKSGNLPGFFTDNNTKYIEGTNYSGMITVTRDSWEIYFGARGFSRTGAWAIPGYVLTPNNIERAKKCLVNIWTTAEGKVRDNTLNGFKSNIDKAHVTIEYLPSARVLSMRLNCTEITIRTRAELAAFIQEIERCERRIPEIKAKLGWGRASIFSKVWR